MEIMQSYIGVFLACWTREFHPGNNDLILLAANTILRVAVDFSVIRAKFEMLTSDRDML